MSILELVLAISEDILDDLVGGERFGTSGHRQITFEVGFNTAFNVNQHDSREKITDLTPAQSTDLPITLDRIKWDNSR